MDHISTFCGELALDDTVASRVLPWIAPFPPECWRAVGNQLRSPKAFCALIKTCRTFQDIFTPFLYRVLRLPPLDLSPQELTDFADYPPRYLRHTKELQIIIRKFNSSWCMGEPFCKSMGMKYGPGMMWCLAGPLRSIRTFRWAVRHYDDHAACMIRYWSVVNILKESETLKNITLRLAYKWSYDRKTAIYCTVLLKGFRNLASLEFYHFFYNDIPDDLVSDKAEVLEDLASALADSPQLQTLGLGMACNFKADKNSNVIVVDDELDFFERLCVEYGSRPSTVPLPIKTLKLGHGMFIMKLEPTTSSPDNYLAKLVKTSGLKTLHIFNGLYMTEVNENAEYLQVEWGFFECTSLHQLSVTMLGNDVREWLNTASTSVQELIVTHHYGKWDPDLLNFNALQLPHLSMLFTLEDCFSATCLEAGDVPSNTASPGSQDSFSSQDDLDFEPSSRQTNLNPENMHSPDFWKNATVLDRLCDGGATLSGLHLDMNLETQWVQFSAHLPNLTQLTQLRISSGILRRHIEEKSQYPTKESSLWPGVEEPSDIAYRYAWLIKSLCPSLAYIRIHNWTWEFAPARTLEPLPTQWTMGSREMENDEILCMQVLCLDRFLDHQAGLPFEGD